MPRRVEKSETAADPGPVERGARSPSIIIVPAAWGGEPCFSAHQLYSTNPCLLSARACPVLQAYELVKRPPLVAPTLPISLSLCPQQKICVCKLEQHPTKWAFHFWVRVIVRVAQVFSHWPIGVYYTPHLRLQYVRERR